MEVGGGANFREKIIFLDLLKSCDKKGQEKKGEDSLEEMAIHLVKLFPGQVD